MFKETDPNKIQGSIIVDKDLDIVDKIHIKEFLEGLISGLLDLYEAYNRARIIDVCITRENGISFHIINEENSHG